VPAIPSSDASIYISTKMNDQPTVVGIGELLWDLFPGQRRLGGAPVNFACHCLQLGATAYPASSVGRDQPGLAILDELSARGISAAHVTEDPDHPTGQVLVTLDADGKPSYEICTGVAWDAVPMSDALAALAGEADAACFGSLAQRDPVSRATIQSFLKAMRPESLKIFDINLRQAFFTREIIESSMKLANVLKLNDEELPVVAEMFGLKGSVRDQLAALLNTFSLKLIAYTRGKNGSLLVTPDEWNDCPGTPVDVVDSVGAGDSFTATLCMGMLNGHPLAAINHHANRVAAFVCSQAGATPRFSDTLKKQVHA
jgi:fructokinase